MTEINRKKAQITASVSPSMKKRCVKIVENGSDYSSLSDIVSQSLSEFLARYDERQKLENKDIVLITALRNYCPRYDFNKSLGGHICFSNSGCGICIPEEGCLSSIKNGYKFDTKEDLEKE